MLDELAITNLGLIESVAVAVRQGLVVVTGETGTGKTMMVGGLRLLVGQTARREAIGPHGDEATVEGRFAVAGDELVIRRVITSTRSRAYRNGSMATAEELSTALAGHVDIVAQHDQLSLRDPAFVRTLIDSRLDDEGQAHRQVYLGAFAAWTDVRKATDELGGDRRTLERELELATYQMGEIEAARLTAGLEGELLEQLSRLRHREELLERFDRSRHHLEAARDAVGAALDEVRRAARLDAGAGEAERLLETVAAELAEADNSVRGQAADLPHDSDSLADLEGRLAQVRDLQRKYGDSVEDVIAFGKAAAARAAELEDLLGRADSLSAELDRARRDLDSAGARLREARQAAAARLAGLAVSHLRDMGMGDPEIVAEVDATAPGPEGADRCSLLFASDARLEPLPVQRSASGGELSRLVLALRLAAGAHDTPVLVFDEIDAGVGGETGLAVGRKLASLAAGGQVICVTHLPQVAAFADQHLVVERTGTRSSVREVTSDDRPTELARMLSGMADSQEAQRHATELLEAASTR